MSLAHLGGIPQCLNYRRILPYEVLHGHLIVFLLFHSLCFKFNDAKLRIIFIPTRFIPAFFSLLWVFVQPIITVFPVVWSHVCHPCLLFFLTPQNYNKKNKKIKIFTNEKIKISSWDRCPCVCPCRGGVGVFFLLFFRFKRFFSALIRIFPVSSTFVLLPFLMVVSLQHDI